MIQTKKTDRCRGFKLSRQWSVRFDYPLPNALNISAKVLLLGMTYADSILFFNAASSASASNLAK